MNRRALILEELQLAPLWIRRELLETAVPATAEAAAETAHAQADTAVPGLEPNARHPLPGIARTANRMIAPLVQGEETNSPRRLTPASKAEPAVTSITEVDNTRTNSIAAMDWATLQTSVTQCEACALCSSRTQAVFGVGNPQADLVVVGEAPGEEEDRLGEPFVGRAGKLLDNMLAAIHEKRGERVFIANVLKCRPPGNRNPLPAEIAACAPYLLRQLELIAPKVILASGRFAAHMLLGSQAPLSALRGKLHDWRGIPVIVTYHPAYLLRNLPDKNRAWDDLLLLRNTLNSRS